MIALLGLGFLIGVRHALEADHLAAVASLATRSASLRDKILVAAAWGGGHAATLVVGGALLIALGVSLPERVARSFEVVAGVVLAGLGIDVLRRQRVHLHVHQHDDGPRHLHLHTHRGEAVVHEQSSHAHGHAHALMPRALAVGSIHGLAGSGALVLVAVQLLGSGMEAFAYVVTFAIGSVLGMMAFSLALSFPLAWSPRLLRVSAGRVEALLGAATFAVGCWMVLQAAAY